MTRPAHIERLAHGFTVEIHYDPESHNNPREHDNLGTMVGFSRDRTIGDEQPRYGKGMWLQVLAGQLGVPEWQIAWLYREPGETVEQVNDLRDYELEGRIEDAPSKILAQIRQHCLILGIQDWGRGGEIAVCTAEYAADISGDGGFIYIEHDEIAKEYGEVSPDTLDRAKKCLEGEVEEYSDWASGNVYGYVIRGPAELDEDGDEIEEGEELESVWGFIGDYDDYCLPEAVRSAQGHIDDWVKGQPSIPLPRHLAIAAPIEDGEVMGIDLDGRIIQWSGDDLWPYNCGETPEEFGWINLAAIEALRLATVPAYG